VNWFTPVKKIRRRVVRRARRDLNGTGQVFSPSNSVSRRERDSTLALRIAAKPKRR
jgi:hypothetical protein